MLERVKRSRVVRIAQATADRYGDDAGGYLAAAIAYYGFLSFFPLVLLGVSIVGFAFDRSPGLQAEVETALTQSVPGVEPLVTQSLRAAREARVSIGLFGLAGLLWTGTGVVGAGRNAVRIVFREGSQMPGLRRLAWLLAVTIGLGVVALTAMALSTLAASLEGEGVGGVALRLVGFAVGFGLDVVLFLVTYRVLRTGRAAWPDLVPGAVFVAIGLGTVAPGLVALAIGRAAAAAGAATAPLGTVGLGTVVDGLAAGLAGTALVLPVLVAGCGPVSR
jgi:membrane protein